jgi:hypothetical protein
MLKIGWQKRHAYAVSANVGQWKLRYRSKKLVRNLDEYTCSVSCFNFGTSGTSMFHSAQRTNTHRHDVMRLTTLDINDKRDATSVMFKSWVV